MNMVQRTWLITGVNRTEQLLASGDRVAGTTRKMEAMADLQAEYGERLWLAPLEMTDLADIRRVTDRAFNALGPIDAIVSNAGYGLFGAAEELTDEQIVHQINTNLVGSIQLARAALPHLRAQGGGRIIQLSTYGGQAAFPGASLYHASKWGIEGFMDALAQEVGTFNIGVTIVEPGGARTQFRYGSAQLGTQIEAYRDTPAGRVYTLIKDTSHPPIGDVLKMVKIIIDSVDVSPAPKRIALGSDAYNAIHGSLSARLSVLEAQKELALSTDLPAGS
jgi:NAD(P)-dependent dehydrogenase (short-subunit alcohol dehydrogenase family)